LSDDVDERSADGPKGWVGKRCSFHMGPT
jgi:hypothetical protein